MKKVLTLIAALTAVSSFAQITIDSTDFGSVGDVIYTAQDTQVTGITITAGSSIAQSWDYSGLTAHVLDSALFLDPSSTPGASGFPNADIALFQDNQYAYLSKTSSYMDLIGLYGDIFEQGIVLPIKSSPAQRNVSFPSTLGTTFNSITVVDSVVEDIYTGIFDSIRFKRISNILSEIDAFGSLTTPSETYSDVLRQSYITTNTDTIWGYNPILGWSVITDLVNTDYTHRFLANGAGFYVLELQSDNNGQVFGARFQVGGKPVASPIIADVSCNGDSDGSITLDVFGGVQPYSFAWSNNETTRDISSLTAGVYTVTIYDQVDSSVFSYTVNEPNSISLSEVVQDEVFGADGSIDLTATGGTSPYSYSWSNSETSEDLSGLSAGSYTVTVTDDNSCTFSSTFIVGNNTAINDETSAEGIMMYPNPALTHFTVKGEVKRLEIYSITGDLVFARNFVLSGEAIPVQELRTGLYAVSLTLNNGEISVIKFVKE